MSLPARTAPSAIGRASDRGWRRSRRRCPGGPGPPRSSRTPRTTGPGSARRPAAASSVAGRASRRTRPRPERPLRPGTLSSPPGPAGPRRRARRRSCRRGRRPGAPRRRRGRSWGRPGPRPTSPPRASGTGAGSDRAPLRASPCGPPLPSLAPRRPMQRHCRAADTLDGDRKAETIGHQAPGARAREAPHALIARPRPAADPRPSRGGGRDPPVLDPRHARHGADLGPAGLARRHAGRVRRPGDGPGGEPRPHRPLARGHDGSRSGA